jgi:hypothetical protein
MAIMIRKASNPRRCTTTTERRRTAMWNKSTADSHSIAPAGKPAATAAWTNTSAAAALATSTPATTSLC